MIFILNRREVFWGNSMKNFSDIRQLLVYNNIKYIYKIIDRNPNRSRTFNFFENMDLAYEYYIYVHKNDYTKAMSIIKNR